jgi:uroporphyrinogen-III synthase
MIEDAGRRVDYLPRETTQEGLLDGFRALPPGTRVLFPVATGGRTLFGDSLRARGCLVDVLHVYDTIPRRPLPSLPDFDVATFASPSALLSFVDHHGASALDRKRVVVIGPTTARQAETSGLDAVVALSTDVDALISAIAHARPPEGEH